jgi:hypothetical protein
MVLATTQSMLQTAKVDVPKSESGGIGSWFENERY